MPEQIAQPETLFGFQRPGCLVERYRKCGKPNCRCAQPDEPGHGPSWSLTRDVKGKTTTKIIPKEFVPRTREQIEEYQRLRHLTSDLVEVNEKICEARIGSGEVEGDLKKIRRQPNWLATSPLTWMRCWVAAPPIIWISKLSRRQRGARS
jgi:hypothetical protein